RRSRELFLIMPLPRETLGELHLRDYLKVLRKHRWLILGVFLVTVVTTAIWTFIQVPQYQATATVMIDPEPPKILNIQEVSPVGPAGPDYYLTQYEIIQSRAVMERVAESLRLKYPTASDAQRPLKGSLI